MTLLSFLSRRAALACLLAFPGAAAAQFQVSFGDPARTGTIASPLQSHRYLLFGGQAGDLMRITFSSQSCCSPTFYYHQLQVFEGATPVGNAIVGVGVLTVTLPNTGLYTIEVRARNNQSTGWYAFQVDRLNDPVGAHRIAFNWYMDDQVGATAAFKVYTLRATAGSSAVLRFTSQSCCSPTYYYHYTELLDGTGTPVATVTGNGASAFNFQNGGIYTLFVAARNLQSTGWYSVSVECQSWPVTPCDCTAHSSNYGAGLPGSNNIVPALTSSLPTVGTTASVNLGNSLGQPTTGFLLMGLSAGNARINAYGADLLVAQPTVLGPLVIPGPGLSLPFPIPNNLLLCGIGIAMQSVIVDDGAQHGLAFSRGLLFLMGR